MLKTEPRSAYSTCTRGVDIGTNRHIYQSIADIAVRDGVGGIWYSTDARELVGVVHRVIVMLQGRINAELAGHDVTVDRIVRASVVDATPAERRGRCPPGARLSAISGSGVIRPALVFVGLLVIDIGL